MEERLTHVDDRGRARMVDVGAKQESERLAIARGSVRMRQETLELIRQQALAKGDALAVARVAGILAAKRTGELVPLCHPLGLTSVDIAFRFGTEVLHIQATARVVGRTGVEMEALTAVSVAALTIYDMCKGVDRGLQITDIRLVEKRGGRGGVYRRPDEFAWEEQV